MPERALQFFDGMQQQGLEPNWDSSPSDHLLRSGQCFANGWMQKMAVQLFDEMQQQGLEPN